MAKQLKSIICKNLDNRFGKISGCVLIDYRGLDSEKTQELRSLLRKGGITMSVVQNRLAVRVFKERGAPDAFLSLLKGPTALLVGDDGALTASKSIVQWRKKNKTLATIKGGLLEGKALRPEDVERLSSLPDVHQLRAQLFTTLMGPMTYIQSAIQGLVTHFVGAAKAHRESLEKSQGGGGAAA
jgi:large subunit ribosomal protein L10